MKRYQVVGIGNAIVDVISQADDSFLDLMGIGKGIMQLVERERGEMLYASRGCTILCSKDGGQSWEKIFSLESWGINNIWFTTKLTGHIIAQIGRFEHRYYGTETG